jgi:hypothetical protein
MAVPPPHLRNTSGSSFSQRLGYYLAGVAVGLVVLGFMMSARQRSVQRAAEAEARAQRQAEDRGEDGGRPGPPSPKLGVRRRAASNPDAP